jgi:Phage protein Gp138 N-terminal domain
MVTSVINFVSSLRTSFISLLHRLREPAAQWDVQAYQLMHEIRVALPGIVNSFDAVRQTVTVQPAIRERVNLPTANSDGTVVPVPTDLKLPLLVDVPVVLLGGGGYVVCPPITAGDECLVIFGDNCFNAWWTSGGIQNQEELRTHDLSDAFAIVGLRSQPNKLSSYSTSKLQIRSVDGSVFVEVGPAEITLNAATVTVTGNLTVNGSVTASGGASVIDGKNFLGHKHTGVTTGGSNSGVVA